MMKSLLLSKKTELPVKIGLLFFILLLGSFTHVFGQTNTWDGSSSNNWNTAANWSLNLVPTAAHDVVIPNNFIVTVNTAAVCKSFTIDGGDNDNTIGISSGKSLTVSGTVIIGAGAGNGDNKIINVGSGTLTCASITIDDTQNNNRDSYIAIGTGTVTVSGDITMNGGSTRNQIVFAGAGTLNVSGAGTITGGTISNAGGGYTALTRGTINYSGTYQTVGTYTYYNLTLSGSGTKSISTGTSVSGNLSIAPTGTATASIGTGLSISVGSLTFGGVGAINGTWGSSSSVATYHDNTYFDAAATGILNVASSTCTAPSTPIVGTITQPTCSISTGTVVLSGLPSGAWIINPGGIVGSGSSTTISNLSPGTYNFTVTNRVKCISANSTNVIITAQPATPAFIASGGGIFCAGSTVNLTSSTGTNITNRYWTGPNNFYSLDQNPVISNSSPDMSGTYIVTGSSLSAVNLVTNGNFSSGKTGFTTEYVPAEQTSSGLNPEGTYDVVALPSSRHANFCSCGDHTSGSGLQMVINGAGNESVIWSQTVNVVPNTTYQFTYWVQTVVNGNDSNPSKIQLFVNGSNAGIVYTANATTSVWTQFTYNWTSGSGVTTAILDLKNENFASGGNDFALDDIEFHQVCQATSTVNVTVDRTSVGGAVTGGTTVCSGNTSGLLTLSGHTGSITRWQSSGSPFSSWIDIANTGTTYTSGALTQTTRYRAVVTSGTCSPDNSVETMVTVEPVIANNMISANQTFCASGDPAQLNGIVPTGGSGTYSYQWQSSPDDATWADIGSATAQNYDPSTLATTTYFRRGVSSGTCPMVYSASVRILIEPAITNNTISAAQTFCSSGDPALLNGSVPTGGSGTYSYQWQASPDDATWADIGSATDQNYDPSTLATTTYFRRGLSSGTCPMVYSASVRILIEPAIANNTISAAQTFCSSGDPALLNGSVPTGGSGTYSYQWQSSPDDATWADIGYATAQNYDPSTLATTTYFRRGVSSGICPMVYSASVRILIEPANANNMIGTNQTFCASGDPAQLNGLVPTGGSGTYSYQWQASPDDVTWADIGSATTQNYDPSTLATTTYFRRGVSSGTCPMVYSASVRITVNPSPSPTFSTSPAVDVCAKDDETYTTQSGQTNYAWTVPGNLGTDYSITAGGIGSTNNTVTIKWLTAGSKTVTVNYTDGNGCVGTAASSTISVHPLPSIGSFN